MWTSPPLPNPALKAGACGFHGHGKPVVVELLRDIAVPGQATPAQAAFAWRLAQEPWIVPIPEATKLLSREENRGAANVQLNTGNLAGIHATVSALNMRAAHDPEQLQNMVGR